MMNDIDGLPSRITSEFKLLDVQWAGDGSHLVWLESRSGKGVLVSWNVISGNRRDLAPGISVRAEIGYGGGDFTTATRAVYFVSGFDLFSVGFDGVAPRLEYSGEGKLSSPSVSPDNCWILFIESLDDREFLRLLQIGKGSLPIDVDDTRDFYMQPSWHPDGKMVSWVSWDHPHMPWESSKLHIASIRTDDFNFEAVRVLDSCKSYFQPQFSPDGEYFSFISSLSQWPNLRVVSISSWETVCDIQEDWEHDQPAWIRGLRTYAWGRNSDCLYYIRQKHGAAELCKYNLHTDQTCHPKTTGRAFFYRQLALNPRNDQLSVLASSPSLPWRVLVGGFGDEPRTIARSHPEIAGILIPDLATRKVNCSLKTDGADMRDGCSEEGRDCFGLLSLPKVSDPSCGLPFVIRIHGGPTSTYTTEFEFETQFFVSLGFGVLSLNYRGSSGAGRKYLNELNGQWGVVDVEDVQRAASYLIREENADPGKIVLAGGSAGGFTLLLSFIQYPGKFRAGICRYPVSDLLGLARQTHRFEKHYLDSLVGRLPEAESIYRERSPSAHFELIKDPLALFQGGRDPVVPKEQSDILAAALKRNHVPHVYRIYPEEGHGWKRIETMIDYYKAINDFLREHVQPVQTLRP